MRRLAILFTVVIIGIATYAASITKNPSAETNAITNTVKETQNPAPATLQDPEGTIDGARTPERIPDATAYELLFRFISENQSERERRSIREYIRQAGLTEEAGIDALLKSAELFRERVKVLDDQATMIKDKHWPNPRPEIMAQLEVLQRQREALVLETINSLPSQLGITTAAKVSQHVNNRVKRKIKIVPSPQSPPGSAGWQHHPPNHH